MPDHFRTHPRAEMPVLVRWRPADAAPGTEVDATTKNIGVGGALLPSPVPLPVDTEIVLLISSPTSWDPIVIPAIVRWATPPGKAGIEPGMGVQFKSVSDRDVVRLNDLLALKWEEDE